MAGTLPFLMSTYVAPAQDGFWIGPADGFEIERYESGGVLSMRMRVLDASLDLPSSRIEAWRAAVVADVEPSQRAFIERFLDAAPRPDRVPAYTRLVSDVDGNLWVRRHAWPGDDTVGWLVFAPDGTLRATATMPERLEVHAIGRDWLLGTWTDPLDVEHVSLLRIEPPR